MRFLIARMSSLGDVVCTLPAAVALKGTFSQCRVTWIVDKRFADVVRLCSAVDEVVEKPESLVQVPRLVRSLGTFDCAFDLQGLFKSGLAVGAARAKRRLGFHWMREGSWLFSQRVVPDETSLHVTDQYVDVVRAAGAECHRAEFGLVPHPDDVVKVRGFFNDDRPLALCNAGAGWATKRWPASHFAELSGRLTQQGFQVAFLGGKSDAPIVQEVLAHGAEGALDLTGRTNVRELVALVSVAQVHIGGDTGSTHIAAALGVPAVGLYSITRPERSCPYGQRHNTLYDPRSLADIAPGDVCDAALRAIGQNREAHVR